MTRDNWLPWLTVYFSGFTSWWADATPLEAMSFLGMTVGAIGVVHATYVRHQRLAMDRRKLWSRGSGDD